MPKCIGCDQEKPLNNEKCCADFCEIAMFLMMPEPDLYEEKNISKKGAELLDEG
jgi:hypothetical protein